MRLLSCTGVAGCLLILAACGHQGITEGQVRTEVRRFMHPPGATWKVLAVPSCAKSGGKNEWQCRVRVRMPTSEDVYIPSAGKTLDLTVVASCTAKRCELARNDWTAYAHVSAPWQAVINDWYHGGIDHPHSCAAVKVAISHLPVDMATYSTVRRDLTAYERKVC